MTKQEIAFELRSAAIELTQIADFLDPLGDWPGEKSLRDRVSAEPSAALSEDPPADDVLCDSAGLAPWHSRLLAVLCRNIRGLRTEICDWPFRSVADLLSERDQSNRGVRPGSPSPKLGGDKNSPPST